MSCSGRGLENPVRILNWSGARLQVSEKVESGDDKAVGIAPWATSSGSRTSIIKESYRGTSVSDGPIVPDDGVKKTWTYGRRVRSSFLDFLIGDDRSAPLLRRIIDLLLLLET